ncbi:oxidoreductase [Pseudorhodobacter turbinis]|uniref:Oxidoreductase n=1 Tax=Pseudorhodobacter turbinis TaxID=2500533 RepID=A0A4P8EH73_9RHOB|nr:Ldh family oxidoreductase [Pseudorhodobacter turbinis]QCO55885.1 oxidoreductase [Pseudorhodobacter turbinis]
MAGKTYEHISPENARKLATVILAKAKFSEDQASSMIQNMIDAQAQECHSHGLYRLIDCYNAAKSGQINLTAQPVVTDHAPSVVKVDACQGNSLLAFKSGLGLLTQKARANGIAAMAINNSFHYSALWWEVELISDLGLVALAMSPTLPFVAPYGGIKPLLGTNPMAFSWPRPGGDPYTFDFATSASARGEIEIRRRRGETLPPEWAIDSEGNPTTDAERAMSGALLPFGKHKGSAISIMVELLAGPLIGDLLSCQTAPLNSSDTKNITHGELVIVLDPARFGVSFEAAEGLFQDIEAQGARLPSQRRRAAKRRSDKEGLLISSELLVELEQLAKG